MSLFDTEVQKIPMPDGYCTLEFTNFINPDTGNSCGKVWRMKDGSDHVISEDYSSCVRKRHLYRNGQLVFTYDPSKHGCVDAIRIYMDERGHSFAELAFSNKDIEPLTIDWTSCEKELFYGVGINGYTKIFDERFSGRTFGSFLKNKEV